MKTELTHECFYPLRPSGEAKRCRVNPDRRGESFRCSESDIEQCKREYADTAINNVPIKERPFYQPEEGGPARKLLNGRYDR